MDDFSKTQVGDLVLVYPAKVLGTVSKATKTILYVEAEGKSYRFWRSETIADPWYNPESREGVQKTGAEIYGKRWIRLAGSVLRESALDNRG